MTPTLFDLRASASPARLAALTAALLVLSGNATSQESRVQSAEPSAMVSLGDLEHAFWVCDYTATAKGVNDVQIVHCAAIYDELKERRFAGDFDALWSWWQQNKPARHAALGALEATRKPASNPLNR